MHGETGGPSVAGVLTPTPTVALPGKMETPSSPTCTALGCGRKPEFPEEAHADSRDSVRVSGF